jgi:hypothetical protein
MSRFGRLPGNFGGRHMQRVHVIGSNLSNVMQRLLHHGYLQQRRNVVGNPAFIQLMFIKFRQFLYRMQWLVRFNIAIVQCNMRQRDRLCGNTNAFLVSVNVWIVFGHNMLFLQ